jgi:hypothetical protein
MNHPTEQDWMDFLYNEGSPQARHEWKQHLAGCATCQQSVQKWQEVMGSLTAWRTAGQPTAQAHRFNWAKTAAVALVAVGLGFAVGTRMGSGPNLEQLKAQLEPELRTRLQQQLASDLTRQLTAEWQSGLDKTRAQISDDLRQYQSQQLTAYALLRRDLENLAVATQTAIGRTYQQLGQLTSYNQSGNESLIPANDSKLKMP